GNRAAPAVVPAHLGLEAVRHRDEAPQAPLPVKARLERHDEVCEEVRAALIAGKRGGARGIADVDRGDVRPRAAQSLGMDEGVRVSAQEEFDPGEEREDREDVPAAERGDVLDPAVRYGNIGVAGLDELARCTPAPSRVRGST